MSSWVETCRILVMYFLVGWVKQGSQISQNFPPEPQGFIGMPTAQGRGPRICPVPLMCLPRDSAVQRALRLGNGHSSCKRPEGWVSGSHCLPTEHVEVSGDGNVGRALPLSQRSHLSLQQSPGKSYLSRPRVPSPNTSQKTIKDFILGFRWHLPFP